MTRRYILSIEDAARKMTWMPDLSARCILPERMDDPALDAREHLAALRALARINRLSLTVPTLWRDIRPLAAESRGRPIRLLDVGCGGGDVLIGLAARAKQEGMALECAGCDASPRALSHARRRAGWIEWFRLDLPGTDLPEGYDVIMCSLLLHHLRSRDAVLYLAEAAAAARRMVLVNDLRRSCGAWLSTWAGTRLLTRSPVVREDGPLSVRAALTPAELVEIGLEAGLRRDQLRIRPCFPWRMQMVWRRRGS